MNRYTWKWNKTEIKQDKPVKVFSCFSCGGGSSMGYKRAGFDVIGNCEIDKKINNLYVRNNHPKYNYCEDLREFNKREDLPEELYHLDILDGSPPCTSFSSVGVRERDWGKAKKFREGQTKQTLDDLFFVFLDTVEKLKPKIVIAENVTGIVQGKAKGYVNIIISRFRELGYDVQIFELNAAHMDVPQSRHRIFFIANRCGYPKLRLKFKNDIIPFGQIREEKGKEFAKDSGVIKSLVEQANEKDKNLSDVTKRITGEVNNYYSTIIAHDNGVLPCVTSGGMYFRLYDKKGFTDNDFRNAQTFPQDYDFMDTDVHYVCGMSVPPNMMANIASEVWEQWLK
jgi:DNA (cytosine-5)-methyltransferase 1